MSKSLSLFTYTAGVALACTAGPVHAQAWIGQMVGDMMAQQQAAANEAACMGGAAPEDKEIEEALVQANGAFQSYYEAQQSGSAARSAFFAMDSKARWTHGETVLKKSNLDSSTDFLAKAGLKMDPQPFAFYRSYIDAKAMGQWPVRDEAGSVVGVYNAFFVRKLGGWKLRQLTLEEAAEYSGPVTQFCHEPGDVLPHRLESSAARITYHQGRLDKATRKLASAIEDTEKHVKRLDEKPESASRKERLQRAEAKVDKWEGEVNERANALTEATSDNEAALKDQEAIPQRKLEAKLLLGITT